MFVDTHAHLTFPDYDSDRGDVIRRAHEAGLEYIINIGSGLGVEDNFKALDLARAHDFIYSTIGFHPHYATTVVPHDKSSIRSGDPFETIAKLADDPKVVAVGEIGLDYFHKDSPKDDQIECFNKLLSLAHQARLPVIIHTREAEEDTLFTLRKADASSLGGVVHCFSGGVKFAKDVLDLGFYVSVTGAVTFKKKVEKLLEVVRFVPIGRLMIETDAPFIAPEPHRGRRNEPAFVVEVAKKIAEIKGLSIEDIGRITSLNARRLFHLPGEVLEPSIAYSIRRSLYLNVTNRCTVACRFCPKQSGNFEVKGYNLCLPNEPDVEDVFHAVGDLSGFKEAVFCGFGEPTLRLELIKQVAARIKERGLTVRLDTDGLANLVHGRNVVPELKGLIDHVSVSMNAPDSKTYADLCPSKYREKAFDAVLDFIREAKRCIPTVTATVVSVPGLDIEACRRLAEDDLGVNFRVRAYQEVG